MIYCFELLMNQTIIFLLVLFYSVCYLAIRQVELVYKCQQLIKITQIKKK